MRTKIIMIMLAILGVTTVSAQSTKIYQYQETEARAMDVWSNAYVKPLTVELKVKGGRTRTMVDIPADKVAALRNDPVNWRSYAGFVASKKMDCDVIVAPSFNIDYNSALDNGTVHVEVVGFPADYVNWKSATPEDMQWIATEKYITTQQREMNEAIVKEKKNK